MKIGYPCINRTLECKTNRTFRLKSYSESRLVETVENNLNCLNRILKYNIKNNILFFRITSDIVPFASHPICKYNWQERFRAKFEKIGDVVKNNNIRISMHPDQFIVLNSKNIDVVNRSIDELIYHTEILDLMRLDATAKIQLHIGGAYDDKEKSLDRFVKVYNDLNENIKKRLVIENDDKIFSFNNCIYLYGKTKVPILFDFLHHSVLNNGESIRTVLELQSITWKKNDGLPMVDYSSQKPNFRPGSHAEKINIKDFQNFLKVTYPSDIDIMLEIKDKENSAIKAIELAKKDDRFLT